MGHLELDNNRSQRLGHLSSSPQHVERPTTTTSASSHLWHALSYRPRRLFYLRSSTLDVSRTKLSILVALCPLPPIVVLKYHMFRDWVRPTLRPLDHPSVWSLHFQLVCRSLPVLCPSMFDLSPMSYRALLPLSSSARLTTGISLDKVDMLVSTRELLLHVVPRSGRSSLTLARSLMCSRSDSSSSILPSTNGLRRVEPICRSRTRRGSSSRRYKVHPDVLSICSPSRIRSIRPLRHLAAETICSKSCRTCVRRRWIVSVFI